MTAPLHLSGITLALAQDEATPESWTVDITLNPGDQWPEDLRQVGRIELVVADLTRPAGLPDDLDTSGRMVEDFLDKAVLDPSTGELVNELELLVGPGGPARAVLVRSIAVTSTWQQRGLAAALLAATLDRFAPQARLALCQVEAKHVRDIVPSLPPEEAQTTVGYVTAVLERAGFIPWFRGPWNGLYLAALTSPDHRARRRQLVDEAAQTLAEHTEAARPAQPGARPVRTRRRRARATMPKHGVVPSIGLDMGAGPQRYRMRATVPRPGAGEPSWNLPSWQLRKVGSIKLALVDLTRNLSTQELPDLGAAGDLLRSWTGRLLPALKPGLDAGPAAALVIEHIRVQPEWEDRALYEQLLSEALRVYTPQARFGVFDPRSALSATQLRKAPGLAARLKHAGFLPHAGLYLAPLRDPDFQQRAHHLVDTWIRQRLTEGPATATLTIP